MNKMENQNKARKYRIVIHNLDANDEKVREIVDAELGDAEVISWEVEREIYYSERMNPYCIGTPQKEIIVKLNYVEANKR